MIRLRNCRRRRRWKTSVERLASGLLLPKLWLPMSPGYPCCCEANCIQFTDDFNRSNSSNIGSDWTETVGDWSISSNKLAIASTYSVCTCNTDADAMPGWAVTVKMTAGSAGDKLRIILDYDDNNNYEYVEVVFSAVTGQVAYGVRIAGSDTEIEVVQQLTGAGVGLWVRVCHSRPTENIGVMTSTDKITWNPKLALVTYVAPASRTIRLGTGDTCAGTATFDDFAIDDDAAEGSQCPDCEKVCNECIDGDTEQLSLESTGITDDACSDCEDYFDTDGTPFILSRDHPVVPVGTNSTLCAWGYEFPSTKCSTHNHLVAYFWEFGATRHFYIATRTTANGANIFDWRKAYPVKPNCRTWNNERIDYYSGEAYNVCDLIGSYWEVTAV